MEVFTPSGKKSFRSLSHWRPQDRMLDVGERRIFSHSHQKGWSDVLVKTASRHLHVFCITPPFNFCPLFSLALLATWYALIHDHCDDKHIISQSLLSPSFNPYIGELLSPVLLCLRMKRAVLVVFYVVWGATLDLSLLSGFPPPAGERSSVTSAAVTLASCPHVFS